MGVFWNFWVDLGWDRWSVSVLNLPYESKVEENWLFLNQWSRGWEEKLGYLDIGNGWLSWDKSYLIHQNEMNFICRVLNRTLFSLFRGTIKYGDDGDEDECKFNYWKYLIKL